MVDHPCKGMTKAQREAFEMIAVNQHPRAGQKTIDALLTRGVIRRGADEVLGRDAFGVIKVPSYHVPYPTHAQWCEWCSEQPENVTE